MWSPAIPFLFSPASICDGRNHRPPILFQLHFLWLWALDQSLSLESEVPSPAQTQLTRFFAQVPNLSLHYFFCKRREIIMPAIMALTLLKVKEE